MGGHQGSKDSGFVEQAEACGVFFGFMAMTHRRQKALTEKVERLEQALKRADSTGEVSAN